MADLPAGITCIDWERAPNDPKGRRCLHYADGGECRHEIHALRLDLVCVEWEKRADAAAIAKVKAKAQAQVKPSASVEPKTPSAASLIALPPGAASNGSTQPAAPALQGSLAVGGEAAPQITQAPRQTAAERARAAFLGIEAVEKKKLGILEPQPFTTAKEIPAESIEALEKVVDEIQLSSPEIGSVWIVKKKTGKDRIELSFSEAATLRLLCDSFPGARVVGLKRSEKE